MQVKAVAVGIVLVACTSMALSQGALAQAKKESIEDRAETKAC